MRAVRFDRYGGTEELRLVEVPRPHAESGRAIVEVEAASINPGEISIREGRLHERWPAHFPEGEGSDFAGVVSEVGAAVTDVRVGDEVIGWSEERASHAEAVSVPARQLVLKPPRVSWEVAGSLYVAGLTALATVRSVDVKTGDTVAVSAAVGGVGSLAVQLARRAGARVIGIAGASNADWLVSLGVEPVAHGDGLSERLRADSAGGHRRLRRLLRWRLRRAGDRARSAEGTRRHDHRLGGSSTLRRQGRGARHHRGSGRSLERARRAGRRRRIAHPDRGTYPLEQVREAYEELEKRHTRGKIVLIPKRSAS